MLRWDDGSVRARVQLPPDVPRLAGMDGELDPRAHGTVGRRGGRKGNSTASLLRRSGEVVIVGGYRMDETAMVAELWGAGTGASAGSAGDGRIGARGVVEAERNRRGRRRLRHEPWLGGIKQGQSRGTDKGWYVYRRCVCYERNAEEWREALRDGMWGR